MSYEKLTREKNNELFFEECQKIEKEMLSLDPEKDGARLKIPYIKIANLMLKRTEDNSGYYFYTLFKQMASKNGVHFGNGDIDLEELIVRMAEEVFNTYKPEKGHLYMFISERFKRRAIDALRSLRNDEYIDSYEREQGLESTEDKGRDEILYKKMKNSVRMKPVEEDAAHTSDIDILFCDLAIDIIKFGSRETSRQINQNRIRQALYSNDVLTVVSKGFTSFKNERGIVSAMNILYMNHCTVEKDAYGRERELNIENMQSGKLKPDKVTCWIPQKEPYPVLDGSEPEMKLPAMNEVYRGYLAQVYDKVISSGTVSTVKADYEKMKRALFNRE